LFDDPIRNRFVEDPLHFHRRKWLLIERLLKCAGVALDTQKWLDVGRRRGELLESNGALATQAINVLYGGPSSSFSPPFVLISAPSFVPSSGASSTFASSLYAANPTQSSGRQGQRPGRTPPGREQRTEYKL